ncbi:MAG: N-acetylmuramoyl-L-alanine amidase [Geitlerinemataceae cyanobacterium]
MGRVILSAGHGGYENDTYDPGSIAGGTTEAQEMIRLRDAMVSDLRSRQVAVLSVPDDLSQQQTLEWINIRARVGDVALEIHANAAPNPEAKGASVYYITNNDERQRDAQRLLNALVISLPVITSRNAQPDSAGGVGRLAFCREVAVPSLLVEVGFLTNPDDRALIQNRREDIAAGLSAGLVDWLERVNGSATSAYPEIGIVINGQPHDDPGILVEGNAYIPIDLADSFGVDLAQAPQIRRVLYGGVVHFRAVALREYNIRVGWNNRLRAVTLQSILTICVDRVNHIVGHGNTSEVQMKIFLANANSDGERRFSDLPGLYLDEGKIEGINHDIAFAQMCVETDFLRFRQDLQSNQNNFGNLGAADGRASSASFSSARIGVRAHIQHLKAYASKEPLVQPQVDPRFRFVTRGIAPTIEQLSGRWSPELDYGVRVLAMLRRFYQDAKLL